jgi:hypothetical protein
MDYDPYTSDELTHFVGKRCASDEERYDRLAKILREGRLRASGIPGIGEGSLARLSVTGNQRLSDETAIQGQIVCFCDIPLSSLALHMRKYSHFGVAFPKSFLVAKGANPVFYVVRDAVLPGITLIPSAAGALELRHDVTRADLMDQIHAEAMALSTMNHDLMFDSKDQDLQKLLFRIERLRQLLYQTVLAFIKPFDSTESEDSDHNFYMEREWRVYGDVLFQLGDVRRIILPASYAERFKRDFQNIGADVTTLG